MEKGIEELASWISVRISVRRWFFSINLFRAKMASSRSSDRQSSIAKTLFVNERRFWITFSLSCAALS